MIVVTVEELDETKECMASSSWTVVGTFRDDQKVAAFARASSEWNTLKGEIIMCPFFQEGSDPINIPTNKYVVRAELHDAQGVWMRTLWENGRELPAPTKTGAEDIPMVNPNTSGSGPSGWQVFGALAVAAGVAYGTYRVTDAMIAPKNKRATS